MVFAGDDDDDYLLSMLVFAGPIFLSTFLSRCAEWKALVERKFNTWPIINCHLTLISSHIGAQLNFQLNSRLDLRKYLQMLGFVLIYAHFFGENKCAKINWAPYSQFLDLYPDTMDDEPRNPYVGDIPEVDRHCIYDR